VVAAVSRVSDQDIGQVVAGRPERGEVDVPRVIERDRGIAGARVPLERDRVRRPGGTGVERDLRARVDVRGDLSAVRDLQLVVVRARDPVSGIGGIDRDRFLVVDPDTRFAIDRIVGGACGRGMLQIGFGGFL